MKTRAISLVGLSFRSRFRIHESIAVAAAARKIPSSIAEGATLRSREGPSTSPANPTLSGREIERSSARLHPERIPSSWNKHTGLEIALYEPLALMPFCVIAKAKQSPTHILELRHGWWVYRVRDTYLGFRPGHQSH